MIIYILSSLAMSKLNCPQLSYVQLNCGRLNSGWKNSKVAWSMIWNVAFNKVPMFVSNFLRIWTFRNCKIFTSLSNDNKYASWHVRSFFYFLFGDVMCFKSDLIVFSLLILQKWKQHFGLIVLLFMIKQCFKDPLF